MTKIIFALGLCLPFLKADTPANCRYDDIKGVWNFRYTAGGNDNTIDCANTDISRDFSKELQFELSDINQVTRLDEFQTKGFFTLIYNQGFEVIIDERKWFAFFDYKTMRCDLTMTGWVHDVLSDDWACFYGEMENAKIQNKQKLGLPQGFVTRDESEKPEILKKLATRTKSGETPEYHSGILTKRYFPRQIKSYQQLADNLEKAIEEIKQEDLDNSAVVPASFEWNDHDMVSPVKDQQSCGSCYAFAATGMYEARARVQTNNVWQPLFSEQDIVSCCDYSQGCAGGFPYLTSKYGQDFGLVEEECFTYAAKDLDCSEVTDPTCKRWRISDYGYIGDFYGGATEKAMREEIYANGPIAISIDANSLHSYEGGIWYPEAEQNALTWDPFEYTNHVVVITGWGWQDNVPFWNIKNSWGTGFGNDGYFLLVRGWTASLLRVCQLNVP